MPEVKRTLAYIHIVIAECDEEYGDQAPGSSQVRSEMTIDLPPNPTLREVEKKMQEAAVEIVKAFGRSRSKHRQLHAGWPPPRKGYLETDTINQKKE